MRSAKTAAAGLLFIPTNWANLLPKLVSELTNRSKPLQINKTPEIKQTSIAHGFVHLAKPPNTMCFLLYENGPTKPINIAIAKANIIPEVLTILTNSSYSLANRFL